MLHREFQAFAWAAFYPCWRSHRSTEPSWHSFRSTPVKSLSGDRPGLDRGTIPCKPDLPCCLLQTVFHKEVSHQKQGMQGRCLPPLFFWMPRKSLLGMFLFSFFPRRIVLERPLSYLALRISLLDGLILGSAHQFGNISSCPIALAYSSSLRFKPL